MKNFTSQFLSDLAMFSLLEPEDLLIHPEEDDDDWAQIDEWLHTDPLPHISVFSPSRADGQSNEGMQFDLRDYVSLACL